MRLKCFDCATHSHTKYIVCALNQFVEYGMHECASPKIGRFVVFLYACLIYGLHRSVTLHGGYFIWLGLVQKSVWDFQYDFWRPFQIEIAYQLSVYRIDTPSKWHRIEVMVVISFSYMLKWVKICEFCWPNTFDSPILRLLTNLSN